MKKAANHPDECLRLEALENLNIMDTIEEECYNELTFLASQICNTPIALISLIDERRQWFKAKLGLEVSETSKDIAFCTHAILQNNIFEIENALEDERFCDNPLVTGDLALRFYAGVPLYAPNTKLPLGTLCVIDNKSRKLNEFQLKSLGFIANQIERILVNKMQIRSIEKQNEKLLFQQTALDNLSEGVVLQDRSGKIIDFNPAATKVLGMTAGQLLGKTSLDADWRACKFDGSDFPGNEHPAMQVLASGEMQSNVIMGINTQSSTRWISINSIPLFLSSEKSPSHAVTTFTDISEQVSSQQKLLQTAKMTSLGEMASGIAHEINTPLTVICSSASRIQKLLLENPVNIYEIEKKLGKIELTGFRIAEIIKGLRVFARDAENDPLVNVIIKQVVKDTISLCSEKFKHSNIKLELNIPDEASALCIPTQLSQVFINLLSNSFDAIHKLPEQWIKIEVFSEIEETTKIFFTDSGTGIDLKIVEKVMQPFFTTKEVGKGTGLGLSISKSIIENFNGRFYYDVSSKNTRFCIELPTFHLKPLTD